MHYSFSHNFHVTKYGLNCVVIGRDHLLHPINKVLNTTDDLLRLLCCARI
jgi:hypothetical protein